MTGMRVAVLTGESGWHVRDLLRAAAERGHAAKAVDFRALSAGTGCSTLHQFDGVLVRTMPPGSLEQVVFRMDLLHVAAAAGVRVLNPPRAVETCVDKFLTTAKLSAAGLPVPRTFTGPSAEGALDAFERFGGDVLVKPLFGSEGRGIVRVSDRELAWRTFRAIESVRAVLYVQEFVRNPGWDVRAFVMDGEVAGSMRRHSRDGWRSNVSQGAVAETFPLGDKERELARRAAAAVGAEMAGVDLLPTADGDWTVIEVNVPVEKEQVS